MAAPARKTRKSGAPKKSGRASGAPRKVGGAREAGLPSAAPSRGNGKRRSSDKQGFKAGSTKERRKRVSSPDPGNDKSRGLISGVFRRRAIDGAPDDTSPRNSRRPEAPIAMPKRSIQERLGEKRVALLAFWARVRRTVMLVLRVLSLLLLVGAALAIGRLVEKHVRTSPAFATQDISASGHERLNEEAVLEAAALMVGQNVFEVSPEEAAVNLERHPWIASAEVSRRLPGHFDVAIREHQPVALISLSRSGDDPAGLYLVSEEGTVFKRVAAGDPVDLPVVTGVDRGRFIRDRAFRTSVLLEVVALMHDYRGAGLYRREPISEVHVELDGGLSLFVGDDAMHVRLGRGPHRSKLRRLRRVLDQVQEQGSRPAYVYLDNVRRPDRVTVRLRD